MKSGSRIGITIVAAAMIVSFAGCNELLYDYFFVNSEGHVGDCNDVSLYCTTMSDFCYYSADGETFYFEGGYDNAAWSDVEDYCYGSYYTYYCEGSGTCYDPDTCCNAYDCYYVAEGETFNCDGLDCYYAADDLAYFCG